MKHLGRKLLLPVAAVALAGGSFAFLASNTLGANAAGEGQQAIAGYDVTNITYQTVYGSEATSPYDGLCTSSDNQYASSDNSDTCIKSVSFDLDKSATPSNVRAVINTQGSNFSHNHIYDSCTQNSTTGLWTCTTTALTNGKPDYAVYGQGITTNTLQVMAAS